MEFGKRRAIRRKIYGVFFFLLITTLLMVIKLPYYVTYPGEAERLGDMIQLEERHEAEGEFMLTTIRMGKANIAQYVVAHFNKYQELFPEKQVRRDWESEREYDHRQLKMMQGSQQVAMIVAFQLAGEPIAIEKEGAIVAGVMEGMRAAKHLKVGDLITHVHDERVYDAEQLIAILQKKEKGEFVQLTYERGDETKIVELPIEQFPSEFQQEGNKKYGLGLIGPVTKKTVKTERTITFDTRNIGGPSAGLMFALEIFNQLTQEDITKGYKIAGTGEVFEDGTIGVIGGVGQKVVAAHRAGADIFFTPAERKNDELAKEAAADIKTDMTIVPVNTVQEALDYLQSIPQKS